MSQIPKLSMEISPELFAKLDVEDKKLELLKKTDPAEYKRVMEPQERLRRRLLIIRANNRK